MHLPDGFLSNSVALAAAGLSAAGLAVALRKLGKASHSQPAKAPLVGMMCAFVFAAQMVNFPVATAVSGHLLGATLLVFLFGPWLALLVMSAVLILQALLFQDGGITALGGNIFNLGVVATFVSWMVARLVGGRELLPAAEGPFGLRRWLAILLAAWISTEAAAVSVAFQLAWSGVAPLGTLLKLLGISHALIGLGEGLITVLILTALHRAGYLNPHGLQLGASTRHATE